MLPARTENQVVFASKLEIKPEGSSHEYSDFFNTRTVAFEVLEHHTSLQITANSVVEIRTHEGDSAQLLGWQALAEQAETRLDLVDALTQTKRTEPPSAVRKFALELAAKHSPNDTALAICKQIYGALEYRHGQTGVHSIAADAWLSKVGVCQDYAHLTLGALRAAKIPARYVSGYLHPKLEPKVGETVLGESHAWVEWFVGEWVAFDPTNDVAVVDRHIVVGHGRDYDDVAPLRGVYAGSNESKLNVRVEITREA
jgi:transglutaminase-like putative cysteine protease